jgi:hypothetical protein
MGAAESRAHPIFYYNEGGQNRPSFEDSPKNPEWFEGKGEWWVSLDGVICFLSMNAATLSEACHARTLP